MKSKQLLSSLFILVAACSPVLADNPVARVTAATIAAGYPIDGITGSGADAIVSCGTCTADQFTAAQAFVVAQDWTVHADPNPTLAETTIFADSGISTTAMAALLDFKQYLDAYPQNPALIKSVWAFIKAHVAAIDSGSASAVESDCSAANMPLE